MRYLALLWLLLSTSVLAVDINDLLAPQQRPDEAQTFPPPGPYPTKDALFGAVESGQLLKKLKDSRFNGKEAAQILYSVITVLQSDYRFPAISRTDYLNDNCLDAAYHQVVRGLDSLADYLLDTSSTGYLEEFQQSQKNLDGWCEHARFGRQFMGSYKLFLQDFSSAMDKHKVVLEQQREAAEQAAARIRAQQAEEAKRRDEERARKQADADAKRRLAEEKRKQTLACNESPRYQIWISALAIEQGLHMIAIGQSRLNHENEVARTSGAENLQAKYEAGEAIVRGKQIVNSSFARYRELGGTASDPDDVRAGSDPCDEFR